VKTSPTCRWRGDRPGASARDGLLSSPRPAVRFALSASGRCSATKGGAGACDGADWVGALEAVTAVGTVVALVATVGCNARDSASGPRFQLRIDPTTIGQIDEPIS